MLQLNELADDGSAHDDTLTLPYEKRRKSRFSAATDGGVEVGVFLPRRHALHSGSILVGPERFKVLVQPARELVSIARSDDWLLFARVCYHLGNRHISLQIAAGELRYQMDHVLDRMVEGLGLSVTHASAPFEPEAGAYHGHGH